MESGRGHGENGMSKSKKQKESVWEVRLIYEKWGRSLWGWLLPLSDGLGGGGTGFCSKVDTEEPVIWLLWGCISKEVNSEEMGDEYKIIKKKHHFSLENLPHRQVKQRKAKVRKRIGGKQRWKSTWDWVKEKRKRVKWQRQEKVCEEKDDGDKGRWQTAAFDATALQVWQFGRRDAYYMHVCIRSCMLPLSVQHCLL